MQRKTSARFGDAWGSMFTYCFLEVVTIAGRD